MISLDVHTQLYSTTLKRITFTGDAGVSIAALLCEMEMVDIFRGILSIRGIRRSEKTRGIFVGTLLLD